MGLFRVTTNEKGMRVIEGVSTGERVKRENVEEASLEELLDLEDGLEDASAAAQGADESLAAGDLADDDDIHEIEAEAKAIAEAAAAAQEAEVEEAGSTAPVVADAGPSTTIEEPEGDLPVVDLDLDALRGDTQAEAAAAPAKTSPDDDL